MSSGFAARWPVKQVYPVTAADLDAGGVVRDEAVERWAASTCAVYLDRCTVLQVRREREGLHLRQRTDKLPPGELLGRPESVVVTASVTEVRPSSFTVAMRLCPRGGDQDNAVHASCLVRLEDATTGLVSHLGDEIRDELIAIERSAQFVN